VIFDDFRVPLGIPLGVIFNTFFSCFSRSEFKGFLKPNRCPGRLREGPQIQPAARATNVWGAGKTSLLHPGRWFYPDETQFQQKH
jgi:hypothetical protein